MDVSLMIGDFKFNYRVAAIVKNGNKILLHKNRTEDFYAIPGGRIQIGEDSKSALKREFLEEMGVDVDVSRMIGAVENFFEYDNKKFHEVMIVYNVEFDKNSDLYNKDIIKGIETDSQLEFVWKSFDEIENLDLRPKSIKKVLKNVNVYNEFFNIIDKV